MGIFKKLTIILYMWNRKIEFEITLLSYGKISHIANIMIFCFVVWYTIGFLMIKLILIKNCKKLIKNVLIMEYLFIKYLYRKMI